MMTETDKSPLISIITVVRNAKSTIGYTVQSLLDQDYTNYEYIVIDGASSDGTLAVLNEYSHSCSFLISEVDKGVYDALNKGLALSKGCMVGVLHAGDTLLPSALRHVAELYESARRADFIIAGSSIIKNPNGERLAKRSMLPPLTGKSQAIHHPALFISRSLFLKYGSYDTSFKISADCELIARFLTKATPEVLYTDQPIVRMASFGVSADWKNLLDKTSDHVRVLSRHSGSVYTLRYLGERVVRYSFTAVRLLLKNRRGANGY